MKSLNWVISIIIAVTLNLIILPANSTIINKSETQETPSQTTVPDDPIKLMEDREQFEEFQMRLLFNYVYNTVKEKHYNKSTSKELIEAAIKGMLRSLDSHSSYVSPEDVPTENERLSGELVGIGAVLSQDKENDNMVTVVKVLPDSPADQAGLHADDIIDEVDGQPTTLMDLPTVISKIKGEKGTVVKLKILRKGIKSWISITRDLIVQPVVTAELLRENIGYLNLTSFNHNSSSQLREEWNKLIKNGMLSGIILDLRYNPGGLLDQAIQIVDMFSSHGTAVSVKDSSGTVLKKHEVDSEMFFPENTPLVILINHYSASAAEIVSGSLQQMGRAFVIGEQSFGKGSVQSVIPLYNGGMLRLTVQHYFTHNDTTPHDVGIIPDLVIINNEEHTVKRKNKVSFDDQLNAAINHINLQNNR